MSVKLISVNDKVRNNIAHISADFFGFSDLILVDNCLKMTAYDVIGGNESKTAILDTLNDQKSTLYCFNFIFILKLFVL